MEREWFDSNKQWSTTLFWGWSGFIANAVVPTLWQTIYTRLTAASRRCLWAASSCNGGSKGWPGGTPLPLWELCPHAPYKIGCKVVFRAWSLHSWYHIIPLTQSRIMSSGIPPPNTDRCGHPKLLQPETQWHSVVPRWGLPRRTYPAFILTLLQCLCVAAWCVVRVYWRRSERARSAQWFARRHRYQTSDDWSAAETGDRTDDNEPSDRDHSSPTHLTDTHTYIYTDKSHHEIIAAFTQRTHCRGKRWMTGYCVKQW